MMLRTLACAALAATCLLAQQSAPAANAEKPAEPGVETGKRIFGVMPNYKTVERMTGEYKPLTTREKFHIAREDSFDWPGMLFVGATSEINTLTGQNDEWGQGMKGFGKHYAAAFADNVISNYLSEAVLPSALHDDPRFFRLGQGSALRRTAHALSWIVVSKNDRGHNTLNVPELLGSGASASIGWWYYPRQERSANQVMNRFVSQIGFDAASAVLKEYWPDIRHKFFHKN